MSEQSSATAPASAWPPMRIALYSILALLVLVLAVLLAKDSAGRRGVPPRPAEAVVSGASQ